MTEPQQQQQQQMAAPYQAGAYMNNGAILWLTNPEDELYKLEVVLRNAQVDTNGQILKTGEPLMNEEGIARMLGLMNSIVNRVTILSFYRRNEIRVTMEAMIDTLVKDLMVNRRRYAIKEDSIRDLILFEMLTLAWSTLKRAESEGYSDKKFFKGSLQEVHQRIENQNKKGFMQGLNPWSRN